MAKRSFIDEVTHLRPRKRVIDWPIGGDRKVVVRILADAEIEEAYFAAKDHFASLKHAVNGKQVARQVDPKDVAFVNRERVEIVHRAFRAVEEDGTETDDTLAPSAAELVKQPAEIIDALYFAWSEYQSEIRAKPVDKAAVAAIVEELKKNTPAAALHALPSTWLIAVISTLAEQLSTSTTTNSSGSSQ